MTAKATFSGSSPSTNVGESTQPATENSALERRTQTAVQNHAIFGVKNLSIPDNGRVCVVPDSNSENLKVEFCLDEFLASISSTNVEELYNQAQKTLSLMEEPAMFKIKNLSIPDNGRVPVFPDDKVVFSQQPKPEFCPPKFLTE